VFHENLYSEDQINLLTEKLKGVLNSEGEIIEIGCWEGKSTVALANTAYPQIIRAIDTWKGSISDGPDNMLVMIAKERDVFAEFKINIVKLTSGNVVPYRMDCLDYLRTSRDKIKFCHIDAAHNYQFVKNTIEMLITKLVPKAILCGDNYIRPIFRDGGVPKAVKEMCPGHNSKDNFWWWENQ
jgi:hypothetical protein